MTRDVYEPCPCGSGKKLKFCCIEIVDDMQRVIKLYDNNQLRMAVQAVEKIAENHPDNRWVLSTQAMILLDDDRSAEAQPVLEQLLKMEPDHDLGIVLHAACCYRENGYKTAKSAIQRAFQKSARSQADAVSGLAEEIAHEMLLTFRHIAARQYLTLAMRLSSDEETQQSIFLTLIDLDSDRNVPCPLRSIHSLSEYAGTESTSDDAKTAQKFATVGCWNAAARLFKKLTEQEPDEPALWRNIGLCLAWDGDESAAAKALHRAAKTFSNFEDAVECETLAQLLDLKSEDESLTVRVRDYPVHSVARLLTELSQHEQIVRFAVAQRDESARDQNRIPVGRFAILNRPAPEGNDLTEEDPPFHCVQVLVFDSVDDEDMESSVFLTGIECEELQAATDLFEEVAGKMIDVAEVEELPSNHVFPRLFLPLYRRIHFPPHTSARAQRLAHRHRWERFVNESWAKQPMSALDNMSPVEASSDPNQHVALAAAINVLDAYSEYDGIAAHVAALRERFSLAPPQALEIKPETRLNSLSVLQLCRVLPEQLSDSQLMPILNRVLLIHHEELLYRVLKEVSERPQCMEQTEARRVYENLANICRSQNRLDEALEWTTKGRDFAKAHGNSFENLLAWDVGELLLRLDDPHDPKVIPLVKHIWEYYGPKVPGLREQLASLLSNYDVPCPWDTSEIATATELADAPGSGELWTPSGSQPDAGESKGKLWLPGQE